MTRNKLGRNLNEKCHLQRETVQTPPKQSHTEGTMDKVCGTLSPFREQGLGEKCCVLGFVASFYQSQNKQRVSMGERRPFRDSKHHKRRTFFAFSLSVLFYLLRRGRPRGASGSNHANPAQHSSIHV